MMLYSMPDLPVDLLLDPWLLPDLLVDLLPDPWLLPDLLAPTGPLAPAGPPGSW